MSGSPQAEERAANRALWRKRGKVWSGTAAAGRSPEDALNQEIIAAAGIARGCRVLDLGAGAGEPTISIALAVEADGGVTACDLAREMLAGIERRAAALELGNIDLAVADMEALPFAPRCFDAVTCRFGFMFVTDHESAAAEARRVLKPGAKAVFTVWGPVEDNTAVLVAEPLVKAHFGEPNPDAPARRHILGAPGTVAAIFERAGFRDVAEREIGGTRRVPVGERFWRARLERNYADRFAAMSADERAALDAAIAAAFEPWRDGDAYVIRSHVRFCVGTAPG